MRTQLQCALPLPATFRIEELLAFHRRDPRSVAERADELGFDKGLVWDACPACLRVRCRDGRAEAVLVVDGELGKDASGRLAEMLRRMLGLTQQVEAFEREFGAHPQLGPLLKLRRGLRVAVTATPFEALSWAIIGQQISVGAAVAVRRRLIEAVGQRHSAGLFCYPGAAQLVRLSPDELRAAGCSATKARTLLDVAAMVAAGELPLDDWTINCPANTIHQGLLAIRGVGPWTASYTLLRGFGWLDGSLHGDVAVRRGLQLLLGRPERIDAAEAEAWLAEFSPWRALVAAHLWALKSAAVY